MEVQQITGCCPPNGLWRTVLVTTNTLSAGQTEDLPTPSGSVLYLTDVSIRAFSQPDALNPRGVLEIGSSGVFEPLLYGVETRNGWHSETPLRIGKTQTLRVKAAGTGSDKFSIILVGYSQ